MSSSPDPPLLVLQKVSHRSPNGHRAKDLLSSGVCMSYIATLRACKLGAWHVAADFGPASGSVISYPLCRIHLTTPSMMKLCSTALYRGRRNHCTMQRYCTHSHTMLWPYICPSGPTSSLKSGLNIAEAILLSLLCAAPAEHILLSPVCSTFF